MKLTAIESARLNGSAEQVIDRIRVSTPPSKKVSHVKADKLIIEWAIAYGDAGRRYYHCSEILQLFIPIAAKFKEAEKRIIVSRFADHMTITKIAEEHCRSSSAIDGVIKKFRAAASELLSLL